jgi:hypothetical protein
VDKDQEAILQKIKGYGRKDAEKVKNILLAYLSEKGFMEEFNSGK